MSIPTFEQLTEFHEQVKAGRITRENFQNFLLSPNVFSGAFPSLTLAADLIPKGWEVLEDVAPSDFDVSKLKPVALLKGRESRIDSDEMRKRAKKLGCNLGLVDGKKMLAEQDKIPVEFRDFHIPLPGTRLRASRGDLYVPCLYWDGDRWVLAFEWLSYDWHGRTRFARSE